MSIRQPSPAEPLTADEASGIRDLVEAATAVDGARSLSEQFALSVASRDGVVEHLLYAAPDTGDRPLGYAQVRPGEGGEPPSAELIVDPAHRRRGIGSALLARLPQDVRLWDHTGSEASAAFAQARGLRAVRALHRMERPVGSTDGVADWGQATLPDGVRVRSFEPGRDEDEWLRVNALAFAHHPEQGALTRTDLDQRMEQPWFDPTGLILIVEDGADTASSGDRVAAFHWTKIDPPGSATGEVYVVGVSPDWQGKGLGRAVTILGLDHLRDAGVGTIDLYVDEENAAAIHTYRALGFDSAEIHSQYSRYSPDMSA